MTVGMLVGAGLGYVVGVVVTLLAVRRTLRTPPRTEIWVMDDAASRPPNFTRLGAMRDAYDAARTTHGGNWQ